MHVDENTDVVQDNQPSLMSILKLFPSSETSFHTDSHIPSNGTQR